MSALRGGTPTATVQAALEVARSVDASDLARPAAPAPALEVAGSTVDYDLHGIVGIRLIDASPEEVAAVSNQLGPILGPLQREPDLVVRFVDRLPASSPMRLLGIDDAGFTDEAFLLLRGKHRTSVRVQIPFDQIGGHRCELVCERGLPAVPLLIAIVNLTVLAKGGLAMHASAFRHGGVDVLVTGWSKGGKTEVLLGFAANGAQYIGDEWIYTDGGGERIFGIPEPIRVWDWHLQQLPAYWRALGRKQRFRLRFLRSLAASLRRLAGTSERWRRRTSRFVDLLERQRYVHLEPSETFGPRFGPMRGAPRKVVFVASHASPDIRVERIHPEELADRMIHSLEEERAELMSYYRKFRFAFPGKENPLLAVAADLEHERLRHFLEGKECYAVYHPYPPSIPDLCDAVRPLVER